MQHGRLINAFAKAGLSVSVAPNSNGMFVANGPKYAVTWYDQGGSAICVNVARHGDVSDLMVDYHAGFFVRTIKAAVQWAVSV